MAETNAIGTGTPVGPCRWCGRYHGTQCPSVKSMEFHPDGSVKRVEFVTQAPQPVAMPGGVWPVWPAYPNIGSFVATAIGRWV